MTFSERVAAIQRLGFSPRQAAFLTTVGLHSGYCLSRQYAEFAEIMNRNAARTFLDNVVASKLADRVTLRVNCGHIYHLFGRRLYAAIGEINDGNRRHASSPRIAHNLMLLDFVLAHPDFEWYATGREKTALFVTRLGIPEGALPRQTYDRRRLKKLSIFLHGTSRSVNFVRVVTDPHASAIGRFVRENAPLLRHLKEWTLHALIPHRVAIDQTCEAAYRRALTAVSLIGVPSEDLHWFTNTRRLVTSGNLQSLDIDALHRYRVLAKTLGEHLETHNAAPLTVHHLPHAYSQFGYFPGML